MAGYSKDLVTEVFDYAGVANVIDAQLLSDRIFLIGPHKPLPPPNEYADNGAVAWIEFASGNTVVEQMPDSQPSTLIRTTHNQFAFFLDYGRMTEDFDYIDGHLWIYNFQSLSKMRFDLAGGNGVGTFCSVTDRIFVAETTPKVIRVYSVP